MSTHFLIFSTVTFGIFTFFFRKIFMLKYDKWKKINKLVSVNTKNKFLITYYSIKLIFNLLWLNMIQYMNNSVIKINKNTYQISYVIEGKLYKFVTKIKRGPTPILQIINNQENDVTRQVLPYLGPTYNCNTHDLTPSFFGYETLFFELGDGSNCLYNSDESITNCLNSKIDLLE
jgi:hypothetical protein